MRVALFALAIVATTSITSCIIKEDDNTHHSSNNSANTNNYNNYSQTFDDEFYSYKYGWGFTDSKDSSYGDVASGIFELVNYSTTKGTLSTITTGANFQSDFDIQSKIESNNKMALVFGASSSNYGYAFYIDSAGHYSLYNEGTATIMASVIIDTTYDKVIVKGGWNNVEVAQSGHYWNGYINDKQVFHIPSQVLTGSQVGFKVIPETMGYADFLYIKW